MTGVTWPTASSQRISKDGEARYQLSLRSWAEGGATRHQTPLESRIKETPSKTIRMLSLADIEARRAIFMLLFREVIEDTQGGYSLKLISSFQIARLGPGGRPLLLAGWAFLFFFLLPRRPAHYQIKTLSEVTDGAINSLTIC